MKTHVLLVSKTFLKGHPRAGQPTLFKEKIMTALLDKRKGMHFAGEKKIHTCRSNYAFWKKRIDEVNAGVAVLSIRQWSGKPYNSKQEEIVVLKEVGIQELKLKRVEFVANKLKHHYLSVAVNGIGTIPDAVATLAENDGLSLFDFYDWFHTDFDGCVIHFTDFRY